MNKQALGLIETVGMSAAVEAADTCIKSANIQLIGYELSKGGGLVTLKIQGDVGAVKSAIDAAKISGGRVNKIFSAIVIPRPSQGIASIIESCETVGIVPKEDDTDEELQGDLITEASTEPSEHNIQKDEIEIEEVEEGLEKIEELVEDNNSESCNLCKDPSCPRIKGQPKNLCIHYKPKKA